MRADRSLILLHVSGAALALGAALFWPRPGQAALLVPLGRSDLGTALDWADREAAPLLDLDTGSGRVITRVTSNAGLLRAVLAGLLPVAVRAPGCAPRPKE